MVILMTCHDLPRAASYEVSNWVQPFDPHGNLTSGDYNPAPMTVKPNLKSYIGTKVILARPMTEDEFLITVKGKSEQEVRNRETQGAGYEVIYDDGYVSWSPKAVFERCYREIASEERVLMHTAASSPKK